MMKRTVSLSVLSFLSLFSVLSVASAQPQWVVGGRMGLSLYTVGGGTYYDFFGNLYSNPSSMSAGFQIGPTAEVIFNRQFAIVTEFNINTQAGTPIEWANSFKYYFAMQGSKIKVYVDAGFGLWFYTGGPYFGIRGGGGALFPIANKLYIPADVQFGPVFGTGITPFYLAFTSGIRYEI